MKTLHQWLDEYNVSHRNPTNKLLHWICVPLIVFSLACALQRIPLGNGLSLAVVVGLTALAYYFRLSWRLGLGMTLVFAALYELVLLSDAAFGAQLWVLAAVVFVLAWIGQFIGHHVERMRPSFLKDLQFLLIGPLWLLAAVYRRLSIPMGPEPQRG